MSEPWATRVLGELLTELGSRFGPCERVIAEYRSELAPRATTHPSREGVYDLAHAAVVELRTTWGPTASPQWVNDIVPGWGEDSDGMEYDCFAALFHRAGCWGYVRIRTPEPDSTATDYLRLILGVVRDDREAAPSQ